MAVLHRSDPRRNVQRIALDHLGAVELLPLAERDIGAWEGWARHNSGGGDYATE